MNVTQELIQTNRRKLMNEEFENIVSIDIDTSCSQSNPCYHRTKCCLSNGVYFDHNLNGIDIKKILDRLSKSDKHFDHYIELNPNRKYR